MEKIKNFIKNNKLLIIALAAIFVISSFFQEEIRTSREKIEKKETTISQLQEELKQSELKIKELSESKEKEIEEVVIINADGSSKTIKNTRSKSKRNSKTLENTEIDKKRVEKKEEKKDTKIVKEETVHKNPKTGKIFIYGDIGFDPGFQPRDPEYGFGIRQEIGNGFEVQGTVNQRGEAGVMLNWGFKF